MAAVAIATVLAQLGLNTLLLRESARARARHDRERLARVWRWSLTVALVSVGLSLALLLPVMWTIARLVPTIDEATLYLSACLLPFGVIVNLGEAALQGLGKPFKGMFGGYVFRPLCFIVALGILVFSGPLTPASAMLMQVLAHLAAALLIVALLHREGVAYFAASPPSPDQARAWFRATVTFLFLHGTWIVLSYTDIMMLGVLASAEEVGLYRIASTGAAFIFLGMNALNTVVSERISYLHTQGQTDRLQRVVSIGALAAFSAAAPLAVAFILYGDGIISMLFGSEFAPASKALAILAVGQLLHVAAGFAPTLLGMTGSERLNAWVLGSTAALNIIFNLCLIPIWGAEGAALASAIAVSLQGGAMWWLARRIRGVDTSVPASFVALLRQRRRKASDRT